MLFPLISLGKEDLCMPPLLPEEMQCMFWLGEQAKSQGKPFSLEDNKNVLDGNELTQSCSLVCVFTFFFPPQMQTSW